MARGANGASSQREYLAYIGTYTEKKSKGIYAFRFHADTGKLTSLGLVAETSNPTFLTVHPNARVLYAANEVGNFGGHKAGAVSAYTIDAKSGKLALLNQVSSRGAGPCHVSVDKTSKNVLVANYDGGSIAVLPIGADGRLKEASAFVQHTGSSVNRERQEAPHAHCIDTSPDNRFVLVADLGLDEVLLYRFDPAHGSVTPNDPPFGKTPPGAGPRHFSFHPNGRFVYVINEIQCTLTTFAYDPARGALKALQTVSTVPNDYKVTSNDSTAEVEVHPSGKFVYGSNRGPDSIAVFAIDAQKGTATPVEHVSTQGKTPRHFALDPTGSFLLAENQDSDTIVVFRIDQHTGRLTPAGQVVEAPTPVCLKFVTGK
jgi:6-phosphogluconolactonase